MSARMCLKPCGLAVLVLASVAAADEKDASQGAALPDGAVARLGSLRLRTAGPIVATALSPDGKRVAAACERAIAVWDTSTGRRVWERTLAATRVLAVSFADRGRSVAWVQRHGGGMVADLGGRAADRKLPLGGERVCVAAAFTPDGSAVATTGFTTSLQVWETATGKSVGKVSGLDGLATVVAVSPDRTKVVTAGHDNDAGGFRVWLWDVKTDKQIGGPPTFDGRLRAVAFSPDGGTVALAGGPGQDARIVLWDVAAGKERGSFAAPPAVALGFMPDGKQLFGVTPDGIVFWNAASGAQQRRIAAPGPDEPPRPVGMWLGLRRPAALSADGAVVASGAAGQVVRLWKVADGTPILPPTGHTTAVQALRFGPDGNRLVSVAWDGSVRTWDLARGTSTALMDGKAARVAAVSADLRTAAGLGVSHAIAVWDLRTKRESRQWRPDRPALALALSPDGRLLAGGFHDGIVVWQAGTGAELLRIDSDQPNGAGPRLKGLRAPPRWMHGALAFSPDGKLLASGSNGVRLYELATGRAAVTYAERIRAVRALAFSTDGATLLACSATGALHVLDVRTGTSVASLAVPREQTRAVALGPRGRRIATGGADTTILLWNAPQGRAAVQPKAPDEKTLVGYWQDLAREDPAKAWPALGALAAAGEAAAGFLKDRLPPAGGPAADPQEVRRLVAELDSDDFRTRDEATRKLRAAGEAARLQLAEALETTRSDEVRARAEAVLSALDSPRAEGETLRRLRAIAVLERVGTDAAAKILAELAAGSPDRVTTDARRALARLKARRAVAKPGD